jgi:hypothetical protein
MRPLRFPNSPTGFFITDTLFNEETNIFMTKKAKGPRFGTYNLFLKSRRKDLMFELPTVLDRNQNVDCIPVQISLREWKQR